MSRETPLNIDDVVSVFRDSSVYEGCVLGSDADLFWLLVLDLGEVQRGHLGNLFERDGMTFLSASEWNTKIEKMFLAHGEFKSDVFWGVKEPEAMIRKLKMLRLLRII